MMRPSFDEILEELYGNGLKEILSHLSVPPEN